MKRAIRGAVWGLVLGVVASAAAAAGPDGAPGVVDSFDNAAVDYWRAAALLQPVLNAEDLESVAYVEQILPALPPRVFVHRPRVGRWLLGERPALAALEEAATRSVCLFAPPDRPPTEVSVAHANVLKEVAERALGAAKALEFVENPRGAAVVYRDLLRLADNLDQDRRWVSAYYAAGLLHRIAADLEGFLARQPSRQALTPLSDYLAGLGPRPFDTAVYLRNEVRLYHDWLREDLGRIEAKLALLYGDVPLRPAVDKLTTLGPAERQARLDGWLDGYQAAVERLAGAAELPYAEAGRRLRELDREFAQLRADPSGDGVNPLIPLLVRPMAAAHEQMLAANGVYILLDIAVSAVIHAEFVQAWPKDLATLERFVGRSFAPDHFTAKPVAYRLPRGALPLVELKVPGWIEQDPAMFTRVRLQERLTRDDARLREEADRVRTLRTREALREVTRREEEGDRRDDRDGSRSPPRPRSRR